LSDGDRDVNNYERSCEVCVCVFKKCAKVVEKETSGNSGGGGGGPDENTCKLCKQEKRGIHEK
jgi:hypothetical protein